MTSSTPDPGDLVRAAAAGDRDAWDSLVDRFVRLLWSVARTYRLSDADTADAVQITWLRLVENLERIKNPDRVGAWLVTTVRNECLLALRRYGRERPSVLEWVDDTPADQPSADELLLLGERSAQLRIAFDGLPTRCRDLLELLLLSEPPLGYRQVSNALGVPIGSIGPTRARCLQRLRENLEATGIFADAGASTTHQPDDRTETGPTPS